MPSPPAFHGTVKEVRGDSSWPTGIMNPLACCPNSIISASCSLSASLGLNLTLGRFILIYAYASSSLC